MRCCAAGRASDQAHCRESMDTSPSSGDTPTATSLRLIRFDIYIIYISYILYLLYFAKGNY